MGSETDYMFIKCMDCGKKRKFPKKYWTFDPYEVWDPTIGGYLMYGKNGRWAKVDSDFIDKQLKQEKWGKVGDNQFKCDICQILDSKES